MQDSLIIVALIKFSHGRTSYCEFLGLTDDLENVGSYFICKFYLLSVLDSVIFGIITGSYKG